MAEGYSDWGNHYGNQYMRGHVVAWCEYTDDDHYKIIVTGNTECYDSGAGWGMQSQVGYDARNSGIPGTTANAGGGTFSSNWCREHHTFESIEAGKEYGHFTDYHREEFGPFQCDSNVHNVTVWYKCWATGSWSGGQRDAFATLEVPRYRQHTPRPPKNFIVDRASDNSQKLSWTGDYTGFEGHYTWAYVHVERKDGNGSWKQIARLPWNATNYADNTTDVGGKYSYRLRASNWDSAYSSYTSDITVYTSPARLTSLAIEKSGTSTIRLTGSGLWAWRDGVNAQVKRDGGDWVDVEVAETSVGVWQDDAAPAGSIKYRIRAWVAKGGSSNPIGLLYGDWCESDEVTTICAPNAPSVTTNPTSPVTFGAALKVVWTPDHPDGTEQSSAVVSVEAPDGTTTLTTVTGAATGFDYTPTVRGTYKFKVKTKGLAADYGAWSTPCVVVVANAPAVHFTYPSLPYDGTNAQERLPIYAEWQVTDETGITSQTIEVIDSANSVIYTKSLGADARSCSLDTEVGFSNKSLYAIRITVRGGSGLVGSADTTIYTDWAQPVPPDITVTFDDDLAATIVVEAKYDEAGYNVADAALTGPVSAGAAEIELGGDATVSDGVLKLRGMIEVDTYDVVRVEPDGNRTTLGTKLKLGYRIVDALPPLNVPYQYEVTVNTRLGTSAMHSVTVSCDSHGMEAFNFGAAAQTVVKLGLNADSKEDVENTGETYYFATGQDTPSLPTFYQDGTFDSTRSLSYVVHSREEYETIRRLARNRKLGNFWYRDFWGHRMYAHGKWQFGYAAQNYSLWDISVSPEEVMWREPLNGE